MPLEHGTAGHQAEAQIVCPEHLPPCREGVGVPGVAGEACLLDQLRPKKWAS